MESIIRPAKPSDLEAVDSLLREVLRVHHEIRPDLFRKEGKKYNDSELLAIFGNPSSPVFVYEDESGVAGYIFCELRQNANSGSLNPIKTLYIDDLCVSPSRRGKGIAKALYRHAESFAREKGCHNITLHVWEGNSAARSFYDGVGMKPQYTSMETVL